MSNILTKTTETKTTEIIINCVCGEVIKFVCPNCEKLEERITSLEEDNKMLKDIITTNQNKAIIRDVFLKFEFDYKIFLLNILYNDNKEHELIKRIKISRKRSFVIKNIMIEELRKMINVSKDNYLGVFTYDDYLGASRVFKSFNSIAHPLSDLNLDKVQLKNIFVKEISDEDIIDFSLEVLNRYSNKYDTSNLLF